MCRVRSWLREWGRLLALGVGYVPGFEGRVSSWVRGYVPGIEGKFLLGQPGRREGDRDRQTNRQTEWNGNCLLTPSQP